MSFDNNQNLTEKQIKNKIKKCTTKLGHTYSYMVFLNKNNKEVKEKFKEIIIKEFGSLSYVTDKNETLLHLFIGDPYYLYKNNPLVCEKVIEILLEEGIDPNAKDNLGKNFIMKTVDFRYDTTMMIILIDLGLEYNLNINDRDNEGNTIMGNLLYHNCICNTPLIYRHLINKGFDVENREQYDKSFEETIYYISSVLKKLIHDKDILLSYYKTIKFKDEYFSSRGKEEIIINEKDMEFIKKYGMFLNEETIRYTTYLVHDKKEIIINNLSNNNFNILYYDNKRNICINDLLYIISIETKNRNINKFNNSYILKTSFKEIVNNCNTIGSFKSNLILLMRKCAENKIMLVIENIDELILNNMSDYDKEELLSFIEYYIDKKDLVLIGITHVDNADKVNNFFDWNIINIVDNNTKTLKKIK